MFYSRRARVLCSLTLTMATLSVAAMAEYSQSALQAQRDSAARALKQRTVHTFRIEERKNATGDQENLRKAVVAFTGDDAWEAIVKGEYGRVSRRPTSTLSTSPVWTEEKRPTIADLEVRAQAFAAKAFGAFVVLGPGERLVPWRVVHEIQGAESTSGESVRRLAGSTIEFARFVDGVPVLGTSSKVSVTFDAADVVVGGSFDWPLLAAKTAVPTVSIEALLHRARLLTTPKMSNAKRDSMDCGYVTVERASGHSLEPACLIRYVEFSHYVVGTLHVIPLAEAVEGAPGWPEAQTLERLDRKSE